MLQNSKTIKWRTVKTLGVKTVGWGKISRTSDMQMTPHLCRKPRGIKEPLDEGERRE